MLLSFCGCGFLGVYHLGVSKALITKGPKLLKNVDKFSGASAGALIACLLSVRGYDLQVLKKCTQFCYDAAAITRKKRYGVLTTDFSLLELVRELVSEIVPEFAYATATDRLFISLTDRKHLKNCLIAKYTSNEHLIECLLASCFIPYVTAKGRNGILVSGERFLDGGLTDNLPILQDEQSITVSPFCGHQDISPLDKSGAKMYAHFNQQHFKVNLPNVKRGYHALFPPSETVMKEYYSKGYDDAISSRPAKRLNSNGQLNIRLGKLLIVVLTLIQYLTAL